MGSPTVTGQPPSLLRQAGRLLQPRSKTQGLRECLWRPPALSGASGVYTVAEMAMARVPSKHRTVVPAFVRRPDFREPAPAPWWTDRKSPASPRAADEVVVGDDDVSFDLTEVVDFKDPDGGRVRLVISSPCRERSAAPGVGRRAFTLRGSAVGVNIGGWACRSGEVGLAGRVPGRRLAAAGWRCWHVGGRCSRHPDRVTRRLRPSERAAAAEQ